MNPMPSITINGQVYSHNELIRLSPLPTASDFQRATIKFCQDWLSGQQEFTIQTSGSTGAPKSMVLQRSQMEASARQTIEALQLKAGETSLICLDTKYIAGQMMLVRSFIAGMNIVAVEPSSNPLKEMDQRIDFVALVPFQLENIFEHAYKNINKIRCAIIGGAVISNSLKEKIRSSACAVYATYGMTETLSHIALQRLNGAHAQDYFETFPTIGLRLDLRGCLCIKASYLPEEIVTNDLAERIDEKKFRWLGRIDNVINSGGVKVIPEMVESVFQRILDSFEIKHRFFITGLPHEKLGSKVTAVFEGIPFNKEIQEEILFEAAQNLNKYELPREFVFVPQFKQTTTGKINRAATLPLIL
jgi:O-succinylbenzoic acid--CoA ligase